MLLLEEKIQVARRTSLANYSFYIGATNENHEELTEADPGQCAG
jgi:dihydroorotase